MFLIKIEPNIEKLLAKYQSHPFHSDTIIFISMLIYVHNKLTFHCTILCIFIFEGGCCEILFIFQWVLEEKFWEPLI